MIRRVLAIVAAAALAFPASAQLVGLDHARLTSPGQTLLVVWIGETPVVVPELAGPAIEAPKSDSLEAVYVCTLGAVVRVYVDCAKRDAEDCARVFKARMEHMTRYLPIDKEATKAYHER